MVIRIVFCMHVAVVQMMFGVQFRVPESGIKQGANLSDNFIYRWIWGNGAMHRVVCRDKKSGVQVHLH